MDGHQHTTAGREGFENAAVMSLEADAPHRARQAEAGQIAPRSLESRDEWAPQQHTTGSGDVESIGGCAERLLDQCGDVGTFLGHDGESFGRKASRLQGLNPFLRPRNILEYANCESSGIDLDHGRVMYHGCSSA